MIKTSHINQMQALKNALQTYAKGNLGDWEFQMEISDTLHSYSNLVDGVEERELYHYLIDSSEELNGFGDLTTKTDEYRARLNEVIIQLTAVLPD